jgi:hypothetical protein
VYTRAFSVQIILIGTKQDCHAHQQQFVLFSAEDEGFYAFTRDKNFHNKIPALSHFSHNNLFLFCDLCGNCQSFGGIIRLHCF